MIWQDWRNKHTRSGQFDFTVRGQPRLAPNIAVLQHGRIVLKDENTTKIRILTEHTPYGTGRTQEGRRARLRWRLRVRRGKQSPGQVAEGFCSRPTADPWMAWLCSGPTADPGHPRMARANHE